MTVITVSQVNKYIKALIDEASPLKNIYITGEISNYKAHFPSGHLYFTLKDSDAQIKAVMFKSYAAKLKFKPDDGLKVVCRGRVSVFERNGEYQVYVEDMQPDGLGSLNLAFEQLKEKLSKEGLFDSDHKKSLPKYPKKIGIATSSTGAVFQDIKDVCKRRYPLCELVLVQTLVQGEGAAPDIVKSIKKLDNMSDIDLIIVGRGGGSIEDLWAFNTEEVARAIYNCKKPVISAVGHETDTTICDYVSDLRAPTPSAAAELAVPNIDEINKFLGNAEYTIKSLIKRKIESEALRLDDIAYNSILGLPDKYLESRKEFINTLSKNLISNYDNILIGLKNTLSVDAGTLNALSPLAVIGRGYSITKNKASLVKSVKAVNKGDEINIVLIDGKLSCTVNEVIYGKEYDI